MRSVEDLIQLFKLQPLPREGGWFHQTYRLKDELDRRKALATCIYFLLRDNQPTQLHRLPGDEIYHAYAGDPLELLIVEKDKAPTTEILGNPLLFPEAVPQIIVPGGTWQAARLLPRQFGFSLMGTTMCPGFDWEQFEEGDVSSLLSEFSEYSYILEHYVRSNE